MSDDYLDFCPIGKHQGRFHVTEPVNASSTASRRPHVRAYLEYMYPDLAHTLDERWNTACRVVCERYYGRDAAKVHAPMFDIRVDHNVWEEYFVDIKHQMPLIKTPRWPFTSTPEMMQDSHPPSPEYAEYRDRLMSRKRKRADRESWISAMSTNPVHSSHSSSAAPRDSLPTSKPTTDVPSNGASGSASESPSAVPHEVTAKKLSTSMPPHLSEHEQRQWFWELAGGNSTFRSPITGPFQMNVRQHDMFDTCLEDLDLHSFLEDFKNIRSDLLPQGSSLKAELSTRDDNYNDLDVVITLGFAKGYGGRLYDRVELLRFWSYMTGWVSRIYDGAEVSFYGHLLNSLMSRDGNVNAVSKGLEDVYLKHSEIYGNGEQVDTEALEKQD